MSRQAVIRMKEDFVNLAEIIRGMKLEGKSDQAVAIEFTEAGYECNNSSILRLRRELGVTETLARSGNSFRGKTHTEETKEKLSRIKIETKSSKGINNYFYGRTKELSSTWKGGITSRHDLFFGSSVWKQTRKFVLKHDDYSCILCGAKKDATRLAIHHIRPLADDWEDRLDPTNLATLCTNCHHNITSREGLWIRNLEDRLEGSWRYNKEVVAELEKARSPLV
jgi:hypothetical protein